VVTAAWCLHVPAAVRYRHEICLLDSVIARNGPAPRLVRSWRLSSGMFDCIHQEAAACPRGRWTNRPDHATMALSGTSTPINVPRTRSVTAEVASEAEKMRRVPGIIYADGAAGRRARIAGTRLDVATIISNFRAEMGDWERLKAGFDWLSEEQLKAALRFYELYPDEIDSWLEEASKLTPEYVYSKHPYMKPKTL
jgi:uncharacterized protein (DUF433 family)